MEAHIDGPTTRLRERAWVEVKPSALRGNLRTIGRAVDQGVKVIPMVKANGYGLGVAEVIRSLTEEDPFGFGVACLREGIELRELGVTRPVMVYSPIAPEALEAAVAESLVPTVSDASGLEALMALARRRSDAVAFQLEVDTGMGRSGLPIPSVSEWWNVWTAARGEAPNLQLFGLWTHLHSADEDDLSAARDQVNRFEAVIRSLPDRPQSCLVHHANSAGSLRLPSGSMDAVRPGIFLYGGRVGEGAPVPEEVVRVVGRIGLIRDVPAGTTLGYGASYTAKASERWATVMVGYGDGLPRALGNRGHGVIAGQKAPIIGRISMDVTVVDITGLRGITLGDHVIFVGSDAAASLTLDDVAALAGTIGYEVLAGLSPRLPRLWAEQP